MKQLIFLLVFIFAVTGSAFADVKAGEKLFFKRCKGCHAFGKKKMGPDLSGISQRANAEWVKKWLVDTKGTWASNDPITQNLKSRVKEKKPKHRTPKKLSGEKIDNLVEFLMTK